MHTFHRTINLIVRYNQLNYPVQSTWFHRLISLFFLGSTRWRLHAFTRISICWFSDCYSEWRWLVSAFHMFSVDFIVNTLYIMVSGERSFGRMFVRLCLTFLCERSQLLTCRGSVVNDFPYNWLVYAIRLLASRTEWIVLSNDLLRIRWKEDGWQKGLIVMFHCKWLYIKLLRWIYSGIRERWNYLHVSPENIHYQTVAFAVKAWNFQADSLQRCGEKRKWSQYVCQAKSSCFTPRWAARVGSIRRTRAVRPPHAWEASAARVPSVRRTRGKHPPLRNCFELIKE